MPENDKFQGRISRRKILKFGAYGICSLCLTGIQGCTLLPGTDKKPPKEISAEITQKGLINAKQSAWFSKLENAIVRCELCPRLCELAAGERGPCNVRENRNGTGYTLVYGNPALVQVDPVERKPFFHVLPGSRALSISTAGCNLACKFCEVWDMALVKPEEVHAYDMPPQRVVRHALESGVKSVSYAFGEPVVFYEYMTAIAEKAKEAGLLNLMHTAGYIQPKPLKKIAQKLDAVNFDLKGFDHNFYQKYVGGELDYVLESLKILHEAGVHIEVTNIIIPTLNDDMEKVNAMCSWIIDKLGGDVPLHFARFYPLYRLSALPRTPVSTLEEARKCALEAGLKHVYIAKVSGHEGENTYCPGCGEKVISRVGFVIEDMKIEGGVCSFCGSTLSGLWS